MVVFENKVFWNYAAIFQNRKLPGLLFPARQTPAMIDRTKPEPREWFSPQKIGQFSFCHSLEWMHIN
jgi:hypothetical protein